MDHEKTIGYLRKNAVVTAEACDMIGMSKQRVSKLKDDGELVPVKQNRGGQTFYRGDILKHKLDKKNKGKMASLVFNRACAICTAEDPCMSIQFYEENVHLLDSIKGVYFYFDAVDAAVDGYYAPDSVDSENGLYSLCEPSCVLEDQNGQQMWLRGLSCGYIGPWTRASVKFLEKLGISEPEASVIFEKKVVKFIKDDNKWIVIARSAAIDEFDVVQKDLSVSLYMTDGKLILLQDKRNYREYYGDCYLKRYKEFASDIVEIIIIPDNQTAREKGYYKESPYGEMSSYDYYQVILIDSSGRELWLNADLGDNDIITEQKDAMAYIKRCGFFCMPGREDKLSQKMEDLIKNKSNQEPKISFLQV